ncbi:MULTISPECIES: class I SAM-dependent methyltransferase [unclassified Sphingopyxis]|uniref:class I SAM-dependent methyltransferase n=1 Tax=unclassified Sphingopyxis TaxID=2614943 RepID=UPI000736A4D1|nr:MULTISPECIES: class I SAM-dependent methyltransferase [unclassified Sphingopyxis]KTE34633.1 methyltransferase type 11 [Sphingopyxis sp. HIX]KTE75034.1 methyltransferase type 11 [Sphingopyxis sp. HXXIV]
MSEPKPDFVPALGRINLPGAYDLAIALMTRERRWRRALVEMVDARPGESIVDIGCGTGTLLLALARRYPGCRFIGVDPDPKVLSIARRKAAAAGATIDWIEAMGDDLEGVAEVAACDRIVSSLVLHQCPLAVKQAIAAHMLRLLAPGGTLVIADYGEQRTRLMRLLFRQIQALDGFELTEPNALGCIPAILEAAGFADVEEPFALATPTGSISLYRARRPAG